MTNERPQTPAGDERSAQASAHPAVDELAAEYLDRLAAGDRPDLALWVARLDEPAQQAELHELVEMACAAERLLPTPVETRTLLRGRYRIHEEIGAGGMGRVFSAYDEELGRRVAIKMLAAFDEKDKERRALFLRESRLLASMQHPNIVAVHEAGSEGGRTFIVMDLVDGRSLADVIAAARKELEVRSTDTKLVPREAELWKRAIGKPIPEGRANLLASSWCETAGRISLELARTLEAAHGCGVLHRDLKPQNVMLLGGANPIVLDFGLGGSVDVTEGAVTQGLYGSVAYLAPEQVESYRVGNDPRTDVYQLGLVLYEMLTLRRAFPGESMGQVLDHIKNGQYKPPRVWNAAIPRGLAAICAMALELDPAHRYQTAADMRADLERYFEGREEPLAMRASHARALWRRARWGMRRHPVWAAAAGMLLVGLATAVALQKEDRKPHIIVDGLRLEDETVHPLGPDDRLQASDTLGLKVSSDRPVYLYALWLYEERGSSDRYVEPLRFETVHDDDELRGTWGLRLAGGDRTALCGKVGDTVSVFGVIAWTATSEHPVLDAFLTEVRDTGEEVYGGGGILYQEARDMLAVALEPGRGLGQPVRTASEETDYQKKRAMLREKALQGSAKLWTLPDAEARELEWRIE